MAPNNYDQTSKLLRKAAYWLNDYAGAFRNIKDPNVKAFREKLLKLAKKCRDAARSAATGGGS